MRLGLLLVAMVAFASGAHAQQLDFKRISRSGDELLSYRWRDYLRQEHSVAFTLTRQAIREAEDSFAQYSLQDMWQVVDQVATYYLGGARTSTRYRTLASCGTIITAWLANNVKRIHQTSGPLIDIDVVRNPPVAGSHKATRNPDDYDLVNACELWLADTATSDSEIERLAQEPRNSPTMTSKPVPIPAMAREMLDGLGDVGVGLGHGYAPPRAGSGATNGHARTW